jgi:CTP-dependent riboflavin kinase
MAALMLTDLASMASTSLDQRARRIVKAWKKAGLIEYHKPMGTLVAANQAMLQELSRPMRDYRAELAAHINVAMVRELQL